VPSHLVSTSEFRVAIVSQLPLPHTFLTVSSDVNKDFNAKAKAKVWTLKAKAKDSTVKGKAKD
jgi:predicted house-cleaning NTP pyrophosphatase (Maf/HAM1 superfamily)